jgi:flagellar motor switch protein FliN
MSAKMQETKLPVSLSSAEAGLVPRTPDGTALLAEGAAERGEDAVSQQEARFGRVPMQLDVILGVKSFRVENLLALERGTVVETAHEHTQDVPVHCGGALLLWAEFEVVEQKLAVRVTRPA